MCREEASKLTSLKSKFGKVPLYGIVHQPFGLKEFGKFFDGEVFLDRQRRFYGPDERWMGWSGFLRWGVWTNIYRSNRAGFEGNLKGEGRLLGGLFVIGNDCVLYQHQESEWGDHADYEKVLEAVQKVEQK